MQEPIYAVGDIHGQKAELERVLELIETDGGVDATVVFLGDYVDRGPDSRGVIQHLIEGRAQGRPWICLKGNHDRLFEWFMEDRPRSDPYLLVGYHWLHEKIGGIETLASYGVNVPERIRLMDLHAQTRASIPQTHVNFLRGLELFYETNELFFAHAGISPHVPLNAQSEDDLLWIRTPFHTYKGPHPKLIIHGHTPVEVPTQYINRVNLDSGAGYGRPLTAVVFENNSAWCLGQNGRVPLAYAD